MNRSRFLQLLGTTAAGCGLSSCESTPVAAGSWPPAPFHTVRAFAYACEAGPKDFLQPNGQPHPAVLNGEGALLSPAQVKRLLAALTTQAPSKGHTACYIPHHSFVFYNAAGHPVASADVCFTCRRYKASPAGLPSRIDYDALWMLVHELGVPADATPHFYENLYRQSRR